MVNDLAANSFRQTILATMTAVLSATTAYAAGQVVCRWQAETSAVVVTVDGRDACTIERVGSVWHEGGACRAPADALVVRQTAARRSAAEVRYRGASGTERTTMSQSMPTSAETGYVC
jgi:hypothetical protein